MAELLIRVPAEWQSDLTMLWKQLRIAEGLPLESELRDPESVEPFDGVALTEWLIPLTSTILPIVTAILGYLVARKGELEIRKGSTVKKFKNMSPGQIREVMEILDQQSK